MTGRLHQAVDLLGRTPGLLHWRRRRFQRSFAAGQAVGCCSGVYDSYAEAAAAAPPSRPLGYDHADAGAMYRDRLYRVYPSDYAMMVWVQKLVQQGARRVFDFGGHIGLSYYAYERMLSLPPDLTWTVCDLPAIVAAGRDEAARLDTSGRLRFDEDFAGAADADVLFTAGCIQFLDDTLAERIEKLPRRPRWLLVNLLPLTARPEYFTLMSIGTAYCPYRIQQDSAFFGALARLGYVVEDRWENLDKDCWVAFEPGRSLDRYHGAALRLVDA